jgi:hypothetical protein
MHPRMESGNAVCQPVEWQTALPGHCRCASARRQTISRRQESGCVYFCTSAISTAIVVQGKHAMVSTKVTLLSLALPVGTWQAWTVLDQSPLVIGVGFAVLASFGIFMAILGATEFVAVARRARTESPRAPALFAPAALRRRVAPTPS